MMTPDTRFQVRVDEVAAKVLDGETIIINVANGLYYSLAGVGSEMWVLLENGRSLGEMAAIIAARYAVSPSEVAADLERLGGELLAERMVAIVEDAAGSTATVPIPPPPPAEPLVYESPSLQIYRDMAELLALDPPTPGLGTPLPGRQAGSDGP